MKNSWKPIRRGEIYCSPGCGGNCRLEAHTLAIRNSKSLARKMGAGWKPRVWENLGWHHCVISPCRRIKIHPGFTAFLGEPDSGGGRWAERGKTAKKALRNVIKTAKADLATIGAQFKNL